MANSTRPLGLCPDANILELIDRVWAVDRCSIKNGNHSRCDSSSCSLRLVNRLSCYQRFYKEHVNAYEVESHGLKTHDDLWSVMNLTRQVADCPRSEVLKLLVQPQNVAHITISPEDAEATLDLAVRTMLMMNSLMCNSPLDVLEYGLLETGWRSDDSLETFVRACFPGLDQQPLATTRLDRIQQSVRDNLNARHLRAKAGLAFEPTDDLRHHLKLDKKVGTVKIFHHVGFLKEHLRLTCDQPATASLLDQLRRGVVPRQLALEVLDSIQKVLFRYSDSGSRRILHKLVRRQGFDRECLQWESDAIRKSREEHISYLCFGERLKELYEELENPTPRGMFEEWLQRRSGSRYMMLATLIGVMFAVFLGILSLAVSAVQAYVSYQAWKHPIAAPGNTT